MYRRYPIGSPCCHARFGRLLVRARPVNSALSKEQFRAKQLRQLEPRLVASGRRSHSNRSRCLAHQLSGHCPSLRGSRRSPGLKAGLPCGKPAPPPEALPLNTLTSRYPPPCPPTGGGGVGVKSAPPAPPDPTPPVRGGGVPCTAHSPTCTNGLSSPSSSRLRKTLSASLASHCRSSPEIRARSAWHLSPSSG
jgi:hypothetical protein